MKRGWWLLLGGVGGMTMIAVVGYLESPSSAQEVRAKHQALNLDQVRQERRALVQEQRELLANSKDLGPQERREAIRAWRASHQSQLDALRQQEEGLVRPLRSQRVPLTRAQVDARFDRPAPADLKGEELALWQKRQALSKSRFLLGQSLGEKTDQERQAAIRQWRDDQQDLVAQVQALSETVAEKRIRQPLPPAPELRIPANASAQQRTELEARHQMRVLVRQRAELVRQMRDASPEERAHIRQTLTRDLPLQLKAQRRALEVSAVQSNPPEPGSSPRGSAAQ